jgi:hypothetical protein
LYPMLSGFSTFGARRKHPSGNEWGFDKNEFCYNPPSSIHH